MYQKLTFLSSTRLLALKRAAAASDSIHGPNYHLYIGSWLVQWEMATRLLHALSRRKKESRKPIGFAVITGAQGASRGITMGVVAPRLLLKRTDERKHVR